MPTRVDRPVLITIPGAERQRDARHDAVSVFMKGIVSGSGTRSAFIVGSAYVVCDVAAPVLTPEALPADRSSAPAATPAAPSLVVSLSSWTTPFPAAGLFSFAVMFGTSHFCIPQSHPKAPYYTQIF